MLVAGERRWRAARLAGLERVPALVRRVDDRERLELALVENLVREDLTPIDVAQACACLIEDFGQGHAELAARLGRSRPAVSNLVRLLELPEEVQDMIAAGLLTEGHGRAILMADGRATAPAGGRGGRRRRPQRSAQPRSWPGGVGRAAAAPRQTGSGGRGRATRRSRPSGRRSTRRCACAPPRTVRWWSSCGSRTRTRSRRR